MKKMLVVIALSVLFANNSFSRDISSTAALTDHAVKKKIIEESIADYSGNCPCPYNTMRNGRACGGRSAYSRPRGASPICYEKQVTKEMIKEWRLSNSTAPNSEGSTN